jgi:Family of unknown function (DUF6477)
MKDVLTMLKEMRRPALLMRAARIGAEDYKRAVHLARLLGFGRLPGPVESLMRLMESEAALEEQRGAGMASYSVADHVDVLIAMVGEARVLQRAQAEKAAAGSR